MPCIWCLYMLISSVDTNSTIDAGRAYSQFCINARDWDIWWLLISAGQNTRSNFQELFKKFFQVLLKMFGFLLCVFCLFVFVCSDLAQVIWGSHFSPEFQNRMPSANRTSPSAGPKDASLSNCPRPHSFLASRICSSCVFPTPVRTSWGVVSKPETLCQPWALSSMHFLHPISLV